MPDDEYKTIAAPSEGFFRDRGSKFLAFAFPVFSTAQVEAHLQHLRKEYHDARHHCYAYAIGAKREQYRHNDDGEPSSTAGKPIYGQILSFELSNVLIVVIRYFGGTLLGVGGLINAYRTAASQALLSASIITKTVDDIISVNFAYSDTSEVMRIINEEKLEQVDQKFDADTTLWLRVRQSKTQRIIDRFDKTRVVKTQLQNTKL